MLNLNNNYSNIYFKFKNHFKNLNFYSIPFSILFIVRKRLNLVFTLLFFFLFFLVSIF